MENTAQNTTPPAQAANQPQQMNAQQQVQAQQMLAEIINRAGLDVSNPNHQKQAIEVVQDLYRKRKDGHQKELTALMREFDLNPDHFNQTMAKLEKQVQTLQKQGQDVNTNYQKGKAALDEEISRQQNELAERRRKATSGATISAIIGGVIGGVISGNQIKKGAKKRGWKIAALAVASFIATRIVAGLIMINPLKKKEEQANAELSNKGETLTANAEQQLEALKVQHAQTVDQAQQQEYQTMRDLAARMLKERVKEQQQTQQEEQKPAVEQQPTQQQEVAAQHATDHQNQAEHREQPQPSPAKDKILAEQGGQSPVDPVVIEKQRAAAKEPGAGQQRAT